MTIDEAIENLKYDIEIDMYINDISPQIAEWLEELKAYQQQHIALCEKYSVNTIEDLYEKGIDDFTENISLEISESLIWGMIADCFKYKNLNDTSDKIVDYVINTANEIAEQLKAGGKDD